MTEFAFGLAKFIPYRDKKICEKVRAINREDICKHPNDLPPLIVPLVKLESTE